MSIKSLKDGKELDLFKLADSVEKLEYRIDKLESQVRIMTVGIEEMAKMQKRFMNMVEKEIKELDTE